MIGILLPFVVSVIVNVSVAFAVRLIFGWIVNVALSPLLTVCACQVISKYCPWTAPVLLTASDRTASAFPSFLSVIVWGAGSSVYPATNVPKSGPSLGSRVTLLTAGAGIVTFTGTMTLLSPFALSANSMLSWYGVSAARLSVGVTLNDTYFPAGISCASGSIVTAFVSPVDEAVTVTACSELFVTVIVLLSVDSKVKLGWSTVSVTTEVLSPFSVSPVFSAGVSVSLSWLAVAGSVVFPVSVFWSSCPLPFCASSFAASTVIFASKETSTPSSLVYVIVSS